MSASERVVQSILYEVGCILIGCLVMLFVPHDGQPFVLMVIFSLLAMVWNFVFNWIFDKLVPGDRLARGPIIRTIHAVLFEGSIYDCNGADYYVHDADDLLDGFYDGYNDDISYLRLYLCL